MKTLMRAARLKRGAIVAAAAGLALELGRRQHGRLGGHVKLPKSGVETPSGGTVTETGSTLLYPLFNLWAGGYNEKYPSMTIQTAAHGLGHRHLRGRERHDRHRRLRRLPLAQRGPRPTRT